MLILLHMAFFLFLLLDITSRQACMYQAGGFLLLCIERRTGFGVKDTPVLHAYSETAFIFFCLSHRTAHGVLYHKEE